MTTVRCRSQFLEEYTARAPLALALERILECKVLSAQQFTRPVLDLGCGDGLLANVLFDEPIDIGIDPDPRELKEAAATGAYLTLVCCYGAQIPKPDASVQTVLSNSVLEHIPDLLPVLKEVFRVLAPAGIFCFTVPAENFETWTVINQLLEGCGLRSAARKYRRLFNQFWKHHHAYTSDRWAELAAQTGFQVVEVTRYDAPRVALGNDALVPCALFSMLLKRFTGRWVVCPPLRRILLLPLRRMLSSWLEPARHPAGCLVFVKAMKPHVSLHP